MNLWKTSSASYIHHCLLMAIVNTEDQLLWVLILQLQPTGANELMELVHNRMPVILHPRDYDRWLTRDPGSAGGMGHGQLPTDLLRPYEADAMKMGPVNQKVGNVRNNGPEMLNSA
jgi:putative SOS response-associated peptidase YedK